jgi:hypothetical protein
LRRKRRSAILRRRVAMGQYPTCAQRQWLVTALATQTPCNGALRHGTERYDISALCTRREPAPAAMIYAAHARSRAIPWLLSRCGSQRCALAVR